MAALIEGGLVADLALAILAIEAAAIWWFGRRRGRPHLFREVAPFLVAGAGLIIALKAALAGWPPSVVLGGLTLSGLAHAVDLARRLRG